MGSKWVGLRTFREHNRSITYPERISAPTPLSVSTQRLRCESVPIYAPHDPSPSTHNADEQAASPLIDSTLLEDTEEYIGEPDQIEVPYEALDFGWGEDKDAWEPAMDVEDSENGALTPVSETNDSETDNLLGTHPRSPERPRENTVQHIQTDSIYRSHALAPATRCHLIQAAFMRCKGATMEECNQYLRFGNRQHKVATGSTMEGSTEHIRTAERLIGLDVDGDIDQYLICPNNNCWELHPLKELYELDLVCGAPLLGDRQGTSTCAAELYTLINHIRTPKRVAAYYKLSTALAFLLQDPQISGSLQGWRDDPEDTIEQSSKSTQDITDGYRASNEQMHGLSDGSAWRSQGANTLRQIATDNSVEDTHEMASSQNDVRHSGLPFGIKIILNMDWYKLNGVVGNSVGGLYCAIANLPRESMLLPRNISLLMSLPGPQEPPGVLFNKVLKPVVDDLLTCETGIKVHINGYHGLQVVRTRILFQCSDMPASRKLVGSAGHGSRSHPCQFCKITKAEINEPSGYDLRALSYEDPATVLQASFEHEVAPAASQAAIESMYGVRHSIMMRLTGMEQARSSPPDPLHNSYLGLAKFVVQTLFKNGMFEGHRGNDTRLDLFKEVYTNAEWPSHIGRLPNRIVDQFTATRINAGSNLKADEWKRILQLLPVALFQAWANDENDIIPAGTIEYEELGDDSERQEQDGVKRDRAAFYSAILSLCVGLRALHAHSISADQADAAMQDISQSAIGLLDLQVRLTINYHAAIHFAEFVKLYGPTSGYAIWAFERMNGVNSRVANNKKADQIATTILRSMVRAHRLTMLLHNPPNNAGDDELELLQDLLREKRKAGGTLAMLEVRGKQQNLEMRLPMALQPRQPLDLEQFGAYQPLFDYMRRHYPLHNFMDDTRINQGGTPLPRISHNYKQLPSVSFNGFTYVSDGQGSDCLY